MIIKYHLLGKEFKKVVGAQFVPRQNEKIIFDDVTYNIVSVVWVTFSNVTIIIEDMVSIPNE